MPPHPLTTTPLHFGAFPITPQIFHLTPLSFALVNLKPLLPGHVLVCPRRVVPRLSQLSAAEVSDLFLAVQRVSRMIERVYAADALNVAIQDGVAAGQSVPHVHAHVIPRRSGDMDSRGGGDRVYEMLEGEEGDVGGALREVERTRRERESDGKSESEGDGKKRAFAKSDAERLPRSLEEMEEEARGLAMEMEKELD
ncbi:HIT-like domain-containing protein [Phyllosticta citribraziliensis]|uniref:Bis(5'-adenosyl)-triphosphatase n=1 Tax=Phyllosticta citribraziliensis TaxID=989973 RepID=A0ABR1M4U9_9PEZI